MLYSTTSALLGSQVQPLLPSQASGDHIRCIHLGAPENSWDATGWVSEVEMKQENNLTEPSHASEVNSS